MLFRHRARLLLGSAALASSPLLLSNSTLAETDTGTMTVTAFVQQVCSLATISQLDFEVYVPGSNVDAEAAFEVDCTQAGDVQVDFDDGANSNGANQRNMIRSGGSELIRYQLYTGSNRTTVWSEPQVRVVSPGVNEFPVFGTILDSLTGNAPVGEYSDTVTVTLTF